MRPLDFDSLSQLLTADFTWRLKEISFMRKIAQNREAGAERTVVRAAIPLLYAHWEGYIKLSAQRYLQFVSFRRLRYKQLAPNFLYLCNAGQLRRTQQVGSSIAGQTDIIMDIISSEQKVNKENHTDKVNTKSNLDSSVFIDICVLLGLSHNNYEHNFDFIDKIVVGKRNHVAHGEDVSDSLEEFTQNSAKVLEMMRQFRTDIENAALEKKYLRA